MAPAAHSLEAGPLAATFRQVALASSLRQVRVTQWDGRA